MLTRSKSIIVLIAAGLCVVLATVIGSRAASLRERVMTDDERYYLPPPAWLRAFSAGYTEVAADLVWIKTLVYFGQSYKGSAQESGGFTTNYLLTASKLDPRFRSIYTYGSALTLFQNKGRPTQKTVEMAIDLLERGVSVFPDDGEILCQLGFMHYYEMEPFLPEDEDDPKRKHHKESGIQYISRGALMSGAPPYAARLSASLTTQNGMDEFVIEHLKALLAQETDPDLRKLLARKLRKALGKAAERDIAETERLRKQWADTMAYVPYDFFLILQTDPPLQELIDPLYRWNRMLDR